MCDDDFGGVGWADAGGVGDIADVEGGSFAESGHVDLDGFGKVVGKAGDFDGVDVLFEDATGFDADRLTVEVGGDVGGDFGFLVDGEEVRVEGSAAERVVLDGLEEGEACAFTFDIEVDEDVFRGAVCEELGEGLCIDLEVLVLGAASVDYGGEPAFAAHLIEAAGAGAGARGGFE